MKISTYGAYIKSLIKKHELEDNVFFTGYLNEREMCNRFLKSNVFVSASIIENESNSLSEAKTIGSSFYFLLCRWSDRPNKT
ncbi:glycosyltransferase [Paenibacillus rhizoplanae]